MAVMSNNDVQSEISYAYLHAAAAHMGMTVSMGNRHEDGLGFDATVTAKDAAFPGMYKTLSFKVQLKATTGAKVEAKPGHYSFSLTLDHYDKYRDVSNLDQVILVVLFMPQPRNQWLALDPTTLVLKEAAYWVSLREALASTNAGSQTVYLPKTNLLTSIGLTHLLTELSHGRKVRYVAPP